MKLLKWIILIFLVDQTEPRTLRKWTQNKITWSFGDPYHYLTPRQFDGVRRTVQESFAKWAIALENLMEFEEILDDQEANIRVFFAKKNHSCYEEFDGKGGVVAHSMYPPFGVLHLDGDEQWYATDENEEMDQRVIDLRMVLIHEIGHTLGLRHSRRKASVMRKHYEKPKNPHKIRLSKYDVRAIRELYGS
ncbi:Protein CBG15715 [Caenorhabditis briggsae]|uniref:Peptidase metallopeptidase domain-containing protein n=2 Tax=Caenorhabditis briggsae TaxID=6238 RepID=A0AAE9D8R7_CAEBR|nr:Protein CBG15715 [Caenorhabditis briggsae]ULT98735.1 hypothetical protein L3Y34_000238 [Caenorhabditis briggsae]CAP33891.1 Protein CBG15715 [Caenorhabditis briggsae]